MLRPRSRAPALPPAPPGRALQPTVYAELGPQCLGDTDDPEATDCMNNLMRSLITATAASSLISTFFIGYFGNLPLALAPGIGARWGDGCQAG